MKKVALSLLVSVAALTALTSPEAASDDLKHDILGISVDMPKPAVQKRLQEIGNFVRAERKRQEIWEVRDSRFSHVVVGFDVKDHVRYVTAVAREDKEAERIAYSDIGLLEQAQQAGEPAINNFNYEWRVEAKKGSVEAVAIARGRDPKFLSTYSLKRLGGEQEPEDEEKE